MTENPIPKDPRRVVRDPEGLNTGPLPGLLLAPFTPANQFFTRSHAPVPEVDGSTFRLRVGGLVGTPLELSLEDLNRLPVQKVTATLVCAGIRRMELEQVRPVLGELPWGSEAISSGRWRGVALADVLAQAGVKEEATHVEFIGLDQVERHGHRFGFGGSVPLTKALGREVLLAFELEGHPLPPEHGYPLRALVPGYFGARSVKWLGEIVLRDAPSANYFMAEAYRVLREPLPDNPRDVRTGSELGELVLNAVILSPEDGAHVKRGTLEVAGWAIAPAGTPVQRVELSADEGRNWVATTLSADLGPWAWRHWRSNIDLAPGQHTLLVRAVTADGQTQPAELAEVWNVKGYANNAWHRITVTVTG